MPPTIVAVQGPAAGLYANDAPLAFEVQFSEPVILTTGSGSPALMLTVGRNARLAVYTGGSGTDRFTFAWQPQAVDMDDNGLTMSSPLQSGTGLLMDAAGNAALLDFMPPDLGGVRVAFAGMVHWLDAADGATVLGSNGMPAAANAAVAQWLDQGPGSMDMIQPLATTQPLRTASGALVFDGIDDALVGTMAPLIGASASWTVELCLRVRINATGLITDGMGAYLLDRSSVTQPLISLKITAGPSWGFQTRHDDGTELGGPQSAMVEGEWTHVVLIRDVGAMASQFRMHVNGGAAVSQAENGTPLTPPTFKLGDHASVPHPMSGNAAFLRVYTQALTVAQVQESCAVSAQPRGVICAP